MSIIPQILKLVQNVNIIIILLIIIKIKDHFIYSKVTK